MKTLLKIIVALLAVAVLAAIGVYVWAGMASSRILAETYESHAVNFPIPFPLTDDEVQEAGLTPEQAADTALARAIERGRHLVESRYACIECHGANFGGGVMIDAFPIGQLLGPNLTTGVGSRTADYGPADWDRIVRHGILPDGRPAFMPSEDFQNMSDEELSDVVAYIRSVPAVDNVVAVPTLGPLGKFLIATGQLPLSAMTIASHNTPHAVYPPEAAVSVEFGRHLAGTCTGCHRADLSGGPIVGGDPSWPPARNLTPHPEGLGNWTYDQFVAALRDGVRPDGTAIQPPMSLMGPYAERMSDVELRALWTYLQSVPPVATTAP